MAKRSVLVVGGGISGLVAAHHMLTEAEVDVTLVEASAAVGGKVAAHELAGIELDAGAESVLARRPEFTELANAVGLGDRIVTPATSGVDVLVNGERCPLPRRQVLGIPYDFDDLAASGVLDDAALTRAREDQQRPASGFVGDVSVGELVRTRMGQQVVERLVEPLLAGVYASSADVTSAETAFPGLLAAVAEHGSLALAAESLVRGRSPSSKGFVSLEGGLGTLTERLGDSVSGQIEGEILTSARATSLRRDKNRWSLELEVNGVPRALAADGVLLALPASGSTALLGEAAPFASRLLANIEYASVVLTTLVFELPEAPALPAGTGMLISQKEGMLTKAVTYTSQKWKWISDAFADRVVVRVSMGRADDVRALRLTDDEVVDAACRELSAILRQPLRPTASDVVRWAQAIPQYQVGHGLLVEDIAESLVTTSGLELCGAWVDGVGIPTCIVTAQRAATRLTRQLQ